MSWRRAVPAHKIIVHLSKSGRGIYAGEEETHARPGLVGALEMAFKACHLWNAARFTISNYKTNPLHPALQKKP